MPNTIVLRQGTTAPSAGSFQVGEPAWDKTNGKLYIKNNAGTMVQIGGGGGGGGGTTFTSSTTAPGSPTEGDEWLDENSGILYTYVTDANTSQWVELGTGTVGPAGPAVSDGDKGDITITSGVWSIDSNVVSNAKLAQVATATFKGRTTAGTGNVEDLTGTQATTLLDTATGSTKGLMSAADKTKLDGATDLNTASAVVQRDASGNFTAGTITAALTGNASTATALSTSRTFALTGDVTGSVSSDLTSGASIATSLAANAVTNADLAQIATATFKGRATAGTGNVEDLTATQATALLNTFTSSLKGLAPSSGGGTSNFLRADGTWAAPAGGSTPNWYGVVYGAWGDCDPQDLIDHATLTGTVAPTPTNISVSVARIAYFVPPADITVNRIRFFGVGATTNVYRVAIYNGDTLARLTAELAFSTSANTWGTAGSALALSLTANQLYFIACSVNATGTTAGVLAMGPTQAATTGQMAVLPKSFPGSLDIDSKYLRGAFAQFAVTTGALPTTAATIATQAAWTGGMPAFWLDSNDAA